MTNFLQRSDLLLICVSLKCDKPFSAYTSHFSLPTVCPNMCPFLAFRYVLRPTVHNASKYSPLK